MIGLIKCLGPESFVRVHNIRKLLLHLLHRKISVILESVLFPQCLCHHNFRRLESLRLFDNERQFEVHVLYAFLTVSYGQHFIVLIFLGRDRIAVDLWTLTQLPTDRLDSQNGRGLAGLLGLFKQFAHLALLPVVSLLQHHWDNERLWQTKLLRLGKKLLARFRTQISDRDELRKLLLALLIRHKGLIFRLI